MGMGMAVFPMHCVVF
uniref:Uncharacterized protein n=1 Tax=Anguilla anguilla TaxID=7936 RepID=A0A0E9UQV6_ANGAN